ncbi:PREDICTED: agamous-like MADS-box protein AGL61 isoform X1 [Tarenaya hassleriana]|uniref:agamous-like MADS-box protein AGL61 isoform X1 n=1 Tax=Tarenaya hassleriana TaxID=28532 RepID=UPI00053C7EAF|nr:PREDICTED: agamous-like MADS-box protein AGL61 isoform X1 [Tarenaya hassleriana]
MVKTTKGKQKIDMKKVENEEDRMITFSKRRSGIFKKINELVTSCDAEVGFLVFSQVGTPFTFSHPSMEVVANRFTNPKRQTPRDNAQIVGEAYRKQRIEELSETYEKLAEEVEEEKEKQKALEDLVEEKKLDTFWWKTPIEGMNEDDRTLVHDTFVELHDGLCDLLAERLRLASDDSA